MIKLELTIEEVNLILAALQELPYRISNDLIIKIKTEGDRQFKELEVKIIGD